jgi:hypothetical protein
MFEPTENQRENTVSILVVHLYFVRWHKWKELEGGGDLCRHNQTVATEP